MPDAALAAAGQLDDTLLRAGGPERSQRSGRVPITTPQHSGKLELVQEEIEVDARCP